VAVRRIRVETQAPYRLIANAITRHLGLQVSHTTVSAWCREDAPPEETQAMPCEYLSVLWALRHEIEAEQQESS
jgi:intein-encoded DNA endonuclease-like protein